MLFQTKALYSRVKTKAMDKNIIERFHKNGGYLTKKEIRTEKQRYQLRRLTEEKIVKRIKPGLFFLEEAIVSKTMIDVERIVPEGVLCYYSAWFHYGLTTQIPQQYHVAIIKNRRVKLPDFPPIQLHYWQEKYVLLGKEYQVIENLRIPISDLEKSVCDAVKFRNKIGIDVCAEILQNYLARKDRDLTKLMRYAKNMRIGNIMQTYVTIQL
jgi:predicted transcriptional regulator of viral defense system